MWTHFQITICLEVCNMSLWISWFRQSIVMYFLFLIWLFDERNIYSCGISVFYKELKHKRGASGTKPFKKYNSLSWTGKISDISVNTISRIPFGHLSLERVPKRLGQPQRCLCTESVEELRRTCWQTNLPQRCRDLNKGRQIKDSESNASYFVSSCNAFVKRGPLVDLRRVQSSKVYVQNNSLNISSLPQNAQILAIMLGM